MKKINKILASIELLGTVVFIFAAGFDLPAARSKRSKSNM
jgi:hypothetical protein